jgi:predicted transcriptional regulator
LKSDNVYLTRIRKVLQGCETISIAENGEDEEISKVLFELASNRRASILFEVEKKSLKMQQIADSLDMTVTETFRHLQRLSEAKLVEKKGDGTYTITSLGNLAIGFLSGFNFILKNKNYFLEHDPACLPYEFVNRLGELSSGEFCEVVLSNFNRIRRMVSEAEEYIWVIADQVDSSHVQVTNEKVSKGLEFKFIMQQDLAKTVKTTPDVEHLKQRRYVDLISVSILVNEKEAFVALQRTNGRVDYAGFFGTDEKFRKWCRDLFEYYWERAERWYPGIQIK